MFRPFHAAPRLTPESRSRFRIPLTFFATFFLILSILAPLTPQLNRTASAQSAASDLETSVQIVTAAATGGSPGSVIVQTTESIDGWAFGTATLPAGASDSPTVKFFLASLTGNGTWQVELRFTAAFDALLAAAPADFPSPSIRGSIDESISLAGVDYSQLSFPFPVGETWGFLGTHEGEVLRALDFSNGPGYVSDPVGTVTAMRGGTVYRPCPDMVMIDHGDGWTTGYYHVRQITVSNGQMVARGQAIGSTSMGYDCGGYAASNHVHVWTEFRGQMMSFAGQDIGGWTVENGPGEYYGCLVKGAERRCRLPTGTWNNYVTNSGEIGSGGQAEATVDMTGGQVGDLISFTLSGYPANAPVAISWKRPGGSVVAIATTNADGLGDLTGQFTIPATTTGDLNILTFSSGASSRSIRMTVFPNVTVTPVLVQPGTPFTITISGFPKQTPVKLTAISHADGSLPLGSITANNTGGGTLTVSFPNGLPNGGASIDAWAPGDIYAQADITINGSTVSGPPAASVTVNRNTVNNWVMLTATNFPPMAPVQVKWIRTSGGSIDVATLMADANGSATGQIRVPATPGGIQSVRFVAGAITVSVPFEVVPRIKVIPGDTEPGAMVDISLRGFGKKETVRIRWKQDNGWVELATVVTSNTGSANVLITVPGWVPGGTNSVRGDGTTFRAQTNAVHVDGSAILQVAEAEEETPTPEPTDVEPVTDETPVIEEPTVEPEPTETPDEEESTPTPEPTPSDPEPTETPDESEE